MIFLITYDLRNPEWDYTPLYDAIRAIGDNNHPLESVWLVVSGDLNVSEITTQLKQFMDGKDLVFVLDITKSSVQGWLPKSSWEWLKKYR